MKRYILFFPVLFLILSPAIFAQGTLNYKLQVFDTQGKTMSNLPIVLVETNTFKRLSYATNTAGILSLSLTEGEQWMMHIGDMKNHTLLKIPAGTTGSGSATVTYDVAYWNRINEPPVDRSRLKLESVRQTVNGRDMPAAGHSILEIIAVNEADRPWQSMEVRLTCYKLNKTFIANTDGAGKARFNVPNNQKYQIDLDGEVDFEVVDVGDRSSIRALTLTYEKIDFLEKTNEFGEIEQVFNSEPKPISNRVMVTLFLRGGSKNGAQEDVYLDMSYENKRYHGVSDVEGKVIFLLPKKRSYKVSFPFEANAAVLDLTRFRGIGYLQQGLYYNPDPRLEFPENYLPKSGEQKQYDINSMVTKRYPDLPQDDLVNIHVKWGNNKINSGSLEALLELGFSVKEPFNKVATSKPLNLAFVLDRSGSMGGESIDLLRDAMLKFVDKLRPEDKVSLIFFDDQPALAYPLDFAKKNELIDIISAISAGGGTNIYDGLKLGYEEIYNGFNPAAINRIVLLTDGYGSQPIDFVVEQSKKYFTKGISVSTIGIGTDCNQALLSLLSKYSGGLEHQVIHSEGITAAMEAEFESLFYPLASDLTVTVSYDDRVVYKTLYGVPEFKKGSNAVQFKLDRVFSSLNKMALMKFKIENPSQDIDKNKVTIKVNYFDETKKEPVEVIKVTQLEWTNETDIEMIHDEQLKKTYSMAVINQALKVIADLCESNDYAKAKENVQVTLKTIKKINGDKVSDDLQPFISELTEYLTVLDRAMKNQH